jgi:hypothetical protein
MKNPSDGSSGKKMLNAVQGLGGIIEDAQSNLK